LAGARAPNRQRELPSLIARRLDGQSHRALAFGPDTVVGLARRYGDGVGEVVADESSEGARRDLGIRRGIPEGQGDGEATERNAIRRDRVAAQQAEAKHGSADAAHTRGTTHDIEETTRATRVVTSEQAMSPSSTINHLEGAPRHGYRRGACRFCATQGQKNRHGKAQSPIPGCHTPTSRRNGVSPR